MLWKLCVAPDNVYIELLGSQRRTVPPTVSSTEPGQAPNTWLCEEDSAQEEGETFSNICRLSRACVGQRGRLHARQGGHSAKDIQR